MDVTNSGELNENNNELQPKSKFDKTFWGQFSSQYQSERVDTETGRKYQVRFPDGRTLQLPSVTTVLGQTKDKTYLENWRKRVGDTEADRITSKAANRGTKLHNIFETYIKDGTYPNDKNLSLFKNIIDNRIGQILLSEEYMFSEKLGCAGTVDCVGYFDGVLSIIDWKTSRKEPQEKWILDYFLQTTAYAIMFSEITKMPVSQTVLVFKIDGDPFPQIFIKKSKDYIKPLLGRIKQFQGMNGSTG